MDQGPGGLRDGDPGFGGCRLPGLLVDRATAPRTAHCAVRLQPVGVPGHAGHRAAVSAGGGAGHPDLAEHGDVQRPVRSPEAEEDRWQRIDDALERFVREMDRLEGRLNFVGYGMLCNQWMLDWGMAWNEHECRNRG